MKSMEGTRKAIIKCKPLSIKQMTKYKTINCYDHKQLCINYSRGSDWS